MGAGDGLAGGCCASSVRRKPPASMDNFSKQLGRHSLKVGIDYAKLPTFYANLQFGTPGSIAFFADPSTIVNNSNGLYPLGFQTPGIVRTIATTSLQQVDGWSHKAFFMMP